MNKYNTLLLWIAAALLAAPAQASLMDESYVVETSESDVNDSLNRISGDIDLGFSAPEQTYEAVHHGRTTPFDRPDQDPSDPYRRNF